MKYMFLIYGPEMTEAPEPGGPDTMQPWFEYTAGLQQRGAMLAGEALEPTATATTLRMSGDQLTTTDGPFAETKEVLGGYYLVEAANLDEAIEMASGIPSLRFGGSVEVRPVAAIPDMPQA
jgi:hypothetical protein